MTPIRLVVCAGVALSIASASVSAGDLNPPPGPVAPTMKTLDELAPGVSMGDLQGDQFSTHVIASPGVYVMSSDMIGEPGKDGVLIDCDSFAPGEHTVTIALRGFSMRGVPGSANAINVRNTDPSARRVHVVIDGSYSSAGAGGRGGVPTALIHQWGIDGVHVEGASSCVVSSVRVTGCAGDGYDSSRGPLGASVNVVTSVFESNGSSGVRVSLPAGGPSSLEFQEISCVGNGEEGARVLYAPAGPGAGEGAARIRMQGVDMLGNASDGLYVSGCLDESISYDFQDIETLSNGGAGTRLSIDQSGGHRASVSVLRSSFNGNFEDGIVCTLTGDVANIGGALSFESCDASGNGGHGFFCDGSAAPPGAGHVFVWDRCVSNENIGDGYNARGAEGGHSRASMDNSRALGNGGCGGRFETMDMSMDFCVLSDNTLDGLALIGCPSSRPVRCRMSGNGGNGTSSQSGGAIFMEQTVCDDNLGSGVLISDLSQVGHLDRVTSSGNGGAGIRFASPVGLGCGTANLTRCASSENVGPGIDLSCTAGGLVRGCEASGNGTFGFVISGNGHTVIENTASRNPSGGYQVSVQGNSVGPMVDQGNIAQNTNPGANYVR